MFNAHIDFDRTPRTRARMMYWQTVWVPIQYNNYVTANQCGAVYGKEMTGPWRFRKNCRENESQRLILRSFATQGKGNRRKGDSGIRA